MSKRLLLAAAMVVAPVLVLSTGCQDREPYPRHVVVLRADGAGCLLDGQSMATDQVRRELELLAARTRTAPGGSARMFLLIQAEPGVGYDQVLELVDDCARMGINKIDTGNR